ncbi:MAG: flagellar assembly protein FliW [Clostridia bacterium]|nr:flagellar assembly protein FliW [Clostridia bacterium]
MELKTKYFSTIAYDDTDVILFESGLFGFEEYKKYILIRFDNTHSSLICLQSIDDTNIAFVMINPYNFIANYNVSLSETDLKELQLTDSNNLAVYAICVLHDNVPKSTTNLRCPVVVNTETKLAKQLILENSDYPFKYPFKELIPKEG